MEEENPDEQKHTEEELVDEEGSDTSGSEEDGEGEDGESDGSESAQSEGGEEGASGVSSDESDGGSDKCAICLQKFYGQELGLPETCEHYFCLRCLTEWSKKVTTCPVDRKVFSSILVKGDIEGPVLRVVDVEVTNVDNPALFDESYFTDPTYCEICGHCDREDRLLLCDNCDLGFHLECLEPPLEYVPIEDWYCPTCEAQRVAAANEASVSQPRATRRQLRLPRTGQSRRLIESIRYATRQTTPDTSSRTTVPRNPVTRRSGGKTKKKTYRKRSTRKAGRKRKRKTRKGKKRSRVATDRRPTTARGRLAAQLGIVPPRPGQVYMGLPTCRSASTRVGGEANCSALRSLRHQAGITPLRIFNTSEDLADYMEVDSDDDGPVGVARPHAVHRHAPVKPVLPATRSLYQNSPDVLGPILNNQMIMLTDRNIHVKRDGTLIPSLGHPLRNLNSSTTSGSRSRPNGIGGSPDSSARRAPGSPSSNDVNSHGTPGFTNNNDASNMDANNYSKESSSTSRRDSNSSWSSPSAGNDPSGARAYEQFLQASVPPDDLPSKEKTEESQSKKHVDEDEGSYSDIEEETSQDIEKEKPTKSPSNTEQNEKNGMDVSDSDLVIDEEGRLLAQTHPPNILPATNSEMNVDETAKISLDDVPSPDSIPLPDSTPPPSAIHGDSSDSDDESRQAESSKTRQTKEEYDPSQPLTSSDEEEHSAKLNIKRKKQQKPQASSTHTRRSSVEEPEEIDLSSIPMPSDDYKKPVPEKIQFSIPSRQKLVSISSLIKRQRGVTKTETRASNNFSLEISKAFGEEKQELDEENQEAVDGAPKLSLVAEIFGSDEEEVQDTQQDNSTSEEGVLEPPVDQPSSEPLPSNAVESAGTDTSRWKTVEESDAIPNVSVHDPTATVVADSDSDDSIAVVDTVQRTQKDDDEIQFISISKSTAKIASNNHGKPKPKSVEKSRTSVLESISDGDSEFESKSDSSKSSEEKESSQSRPTRRKLSVVSGNAEEGEIVDSPEKRRKRKKEKKKGKKRRKSKEDKTRFVFSEKRPSSSGPKPAVQIPSEEENQSENVSWKKPTHSAKERNYRDGKPKTEERYFKTTPKKRDTSPKRVENTKEPSDRDRPPKDKPRSSQKGRSRSRSKSAPKDRAARRISSRPRRSVSSTRSRSRSRSRSDRRRRRRRLSASPRRSRSRSRSRGSQARRSRSPGRGRRRSSSFNNLRRRKLSRRSNSSASSGSSRTGGRRHKGRNELRDRKKKPKETEKTKEKAAEVKDAKDKDKERDKDKDKKKRKRRKEKSISPAKAIFADGDSIVVSLNFQKNTTVNTTKDVSRSPSRNDSEGDKKRNKRARHVRTTSQTEGDGKPKFLKKTLLIDLETSPVQEQNIGVSPTLIVLSDDEDGELRKGLKNDDGGASNGPLDKSGRSESPFVKLPGINDGSLQGSNESHDNLLNNGSLSPSENSNLTPVRSNDSANILRDENGPIRSRTSGGLSRSPLNDDNMDIEPHSPAGSPPPLASSTPPSMHSVAGRDTSMTAGGLQPSSTSHFQKPVGGSSSNFFGNSNLPAGGVPPPSMIPAPQVSQVRFPTGVNQNMFTTNLLASLYGPILAARQQQQGSGCNNATSLNSKSNNSSTNILLPKNQLAQFNHSRSKGTGQTAPGDSPFSPNSSDGDDLFEPPIDRGNGDAAVRPEKPAPQSSSAAGAGTSGGPKPKGTLFDSLFGSGSKKPSTPVKSHSKASKGKAGGNQSKQKTKKHKKEVVKLTEGELRLTEDVPNSAVELRVKEKFLKKLNRQERVVEEVKLALKPHYSKKHVTKEEYKDILRRAVPKICHNKSGEINPSKIKELIEAYVKKIRHGRKKDA